MRALWPGGGGSQAHYDGRMGTHHLCDLATRRVFHGTSSLGGDRYELHEFRAHQPQVLHMRAEEDGGLCPMPCWEVRAVFPPVSAGSYIFCAP
jgi:hypothetical protein